MLILSKHTKSKPVPQCKFKNCSHMCAYRCAPLSYTIQHRTFLIIFFSDIQAIITAKMLSIRGGWPDNVVVTW